MKKLAIKFLLLSLVFITSCSDSEDVRGDVPDLITSLDSDITSQSIYVTGTITNDGGEDIEERGFCFSLNSNPTINDSYVLADGSGTGSYYVDLITYLEPNTTYHVRAFATNTIGTSYGNDLVLKTKDLLTFKDTNIDAIMAARVIVSNQIEETDFTIIQRGFVFSKNDNPTIFDNVSVEGNIGYGNYTMTIKELSPDTVYYIRPYSYLSGNDKPIYGEQLVFRTVGYTGPSGGYVVYDKGVESDGWRYLESARNFDNNSTWGCSYGYIPNLSTEIGTGYENTIKILDLCNLSYPAKYCNDYNEGGNDDWFLGSAEEMIVVYTSLLDLGQIYRSRTWTSSEYSDTNTYTVKEDYNHSSGETYIGNYITPKSYVSGVIPIRKY